MFVYGFRLADLTVQGALFFPVDISFRYSRFTEGHVLYVHVSLSYRYHIVYIHMIHIYIYVYTHTHTHIYIYIYIK